MAGEAEVDEPLAVEGAGHVLQQPDAPLAVLDQLVVGRQDTRDAALGGERGNAFYWSYDLELPVSGRTLKVHFEDWMYLMDDRVMLNRATMSKWGIRLGEVTLSFVRRGA